MIRLGAWNSTVPSNIFGIRVEYYDTTEAFCSTMCLGHDELARSAMKCYKMSYKRDIIHNFFYFAPLYALFKLNETFLFKMWKNNIKRNTTCLVDDFFQHQYSVTLHYKVACIIRYYL
jgi:hypothetical protein